MSAFFIIAKQEDTTQTNPESGEARENLAAPWLLLCSPLGGPGKEWCILDT
jgi:hypothetical protein